MSLQDEQTEMIDEDNEAESVSIKIDVPAAVAERPNTAQRGYSSPYTVHLTGYQYDRFPPDARREINSMLIHGTDREPYPEDFTGEWQDFPRVARLRMNLTSLSQHYDLYFVAYRGYIHVYRLNCNGKSIIKGSPLLILDPEQCKTPMAAFAQGHVNPTCPHEVNHMIIGDLGTKEILLIARDNGDVVAWYTRSIAHYIEANTAWERSSHDRTRHTNSTKPSPPTHFFAANVGLSAWGLAIHAKTRIIAVSSNTSEVTVFAFALRDYAVNTQFEQIPHCSREPLVHEQGEGDEETLEDSFGTRQRTWRIIITFGREASNLPSISFCDDADGNADRIAAIDIQGYLWVADIWKVGTRRILSLPHIVPYPQGQPYDNVIGWNVLAVSDAQLRPTKSVRAAIGLRPSRVVSRARKSRGSWYDISKCMVQVKDDAAHEDHVARVRMHRASELDSQDDVTFGAILRAAKAQDAKGGATVTVSRDIDGNGGYRLAMTIFNGTGHHFQGDQVFGGRWAHYLYLKTAERRKLDFQRAEVLEPTGQDDSDTACLSGISFLRANTEDVEMLNLDRDGCGVACHYVLPPLPHHQSLVPWDYHGMGKRISMLLTIPELNLVILGSMHGRVALITLTKPPRMEGRRVPLRAFRVDAVLPFKNEVYWQPWVCLLGMAVSPAPETRAQGLRLRKTRPATYGGRRKSTNMSEEEPDAPRKWRLILTYQDHTILQYEITRKGAAEKDSATWEARALRKQGLDSGDDDSGADDLDEGEEDEEGEDDWPLPENV